MLVEVDAHSGHREAFSSILQNFTGPPAADRFIVHGLFCFGCFLLAGNWNTLSPIFRLVEARFNVGVGAVNAVALSTFLTFVPGSIFALAFLESHGLRPGIILGATAQLTNYSLKYLAASSGSLSPRSAYGVFMCGQLVGGLGQAFFLNTVTRVTMDWFPSDERDLATAVAYQCIGLGVMFFAFVPPRLVHTPDELSRIIFLEMFLWAVLLALLARFLRERPDRPPSASAARQWEARDTARAERAARRRLGLDGDGGGGPGGGARGFLEAELEPLLQHGGELARNPNFLALALSYAPVLGMARALPAVAGELLEPCGFSPVVAGNCGALLAGFGILGNCFAGPAMQQTKRYLLLQRVAIIATAALCVKVVSAARSGSAAGLYFAWALLGFFQGPLPPITLEHSAEMTYPLPPEMSATALSLTIDGVNFCELMVLTFMVASPSRDLEACSSGAISVRLVTVATFVSIGVVSVLCVREVKRRTLAETEDGDVGGLRHQPRGAGGSSIWPWASEEILSPTAAGEKRPLLPHVVAPPSTAGVVGVVVRPIDLL